MRIVAIVVSLAITAVAVALAVQAVRSMLRVIRSGQPAPGRSGDPGHRTATMLKETIGHTRMLQWTWVGVMHWFVFAGFIFLSSLVAHAYVQIFDPDAALPVIGHWLVYEWPVEVLSWLTLLGIVWLIVVRQRQHPRGLERRSRFFGSTFWQAYFVEAVILSVVLCGLILRTLEYGLTRADDPGYPLALHYPLTGWLGELWNGASVTTMENVVYVVAMVKIVISMTWLIVISRNITMGVAWHRFTAWFNIWFKRHPDGTSLGGLQPIVIGGKALNMEAMEELEEEDFERLGVGKVEDFTWKGLLDFTTCTECGRCQSQCPAWNTEKPLSPKLLVMGLREHAYAKIPLLDADADTLTEEQRTELERPLIGDADAYGVIDPDVLWSCTNCGACVQQCPVDIEHVDHIDDMRRFQVLVESNFPAELNTIFKGLERKGNPWGMNAKDRLDWTKGLDFEVKQVGVDVESLEEVEWLFWVGCAGAFEDRAKKTTQAVAELLHTAGVDFAVLGDGETCTGDPARRAGNEIVFMQLAMENAEVMRETKATKVVATCAHCFNTLKNEYAEFGVDLEVVHHTQLLNRLVREGRLKPVAAPAASNGTASNGTASNGTGSNGTGAASTVTYHDPCFLGRHNQVYEPPRELLEILPDTRFAEMPRNSDRSFCCGAGGARMWMEENLGSRINANRTEEAVATGADRIAVGCPFCRIMLSDGLTAQQAAGNARDEVEVLDVAQMLLAAVQREPEPVAVGVPATATGGETGAAAAAATLDAPASTSSEEDITVGAEHNIDVDAEGVGHGPDSSGTAPEPGDTESPESEMVPPAETTEESGASSGTDGESAPSAEDPGDVSLSPAERMSTEGVEEGERDPVDDVVRREEESATTAADDAPASDDPDTGHDPDVPGR